MVAPMTANNTPTLRPGLILALLVLPPLFCFGAGVPHPAVLSVFLTVIGLWLTEAIPLPVTGILVPLLATLYGALPAAKAFESFGSDILFLFLGCFLMSCSMEKHGFDKRIAYALLGYCTPGTSFRAINLVIVAVSFVLSMWISNTSATAILAAVTVGVLAGLEKEVKDPAVNRRIAARLLLSCAFAASIGGLVTPVGSPPNLIALKLLAQRGITISFYEWMVLTLPIGLLMLVLMIGIFELVFPLRGVTFPGIRRHFRTLLSECGPMGRGEIQIALVFLLVILMWIVPGVLVSIFPADPLFVTLNSRLSMSVVGLLGGVVMFMLPVPAGGRSVANLSWSATEKLEWGTLMLFGGGLTLGALLESSGAAADLSATLFQDGPQHPLLFGAIIILSSILMSEFASNTAAASILIPLILGAVSSHGLAADAVLNLVLAATFGASFGFMLPVSTPPNAIVYGTGRVSAVDMRRAGILLDISGAVVIFLFMMLR